MMDTTDLQIHIQTGYGIMESYNNVRYISNGISGNHCTMVSTQEICKLISNGERMITDEIKRLTICFRSNNMDVYFPLVINGMRVIPESVEEVNIELPGNLADIPKKTNSKPLFVDGLITGGIKALHDNIKIICISGDVRDLLVVEKQRALPTNLKSITFHNYKSPFIVDGMSIFPDNLRSVYIYNDMPYDHPFGLSNGSDIIKAFPDSITELHYYMNTKKANHKSDIFFMGGVTLLPENLTMLDLTIDDTIDFIVNGIYVIPNKTQKVIFRYESNSLLSFTKNNISIFPDSVINLQIFAKDLKIKLSSNGTFGLPVNLKKLILDTRSISIDSCDNNKIIFPDSLENLQICGDGIKSSDILIMSTNIKKLILQLSDWNDIKNKEFFPQDLNKLNLLRKCYPIQKISTDYNKIAVNICYKNGLCILPPNLKSIEIDFNDVTLIVQKIIIIIACLPYPIADEVINEIM